MAFGIKREELVAWKNNVEKGDSVVFLTHYWLHPRFPTIKTITKAGCSNLDLLQEWGKKYDLKPEWIHKREQYPHFDLIGDKQVQILNEEGVLEQVKRFHLK
ncbi:hypothetical protein ACOI1C_00655 [Bacillus sp. DJP31]|uniref:hypothetical protein n=1 Tax=Bacillus sp. DJP31 TaxID=3409789 RepID=UPI003BB529B1